MIDGDLEMAGKTSDRNGGFGAKQGISVQDIVKSGLK
jgi:hypothetical protein